MISPEAKHICDMIEKVSADDTAVLGRVRFPAALLTYGELNNGYS